MPKRQFHLLDGVSFGKDNTMGRLGFGRRARMKSSSVTGKISPSISLYRGLQSIPDFHFLWKGESCS